MIKGKIVLQNSLLSFSKFFLFWALIVQIVFIATWAVGQNQPPVRKDSAAGKQVNGVPSKKLPSWQNVRSVDDFFDEYVVQNPMAKKLITDRYVNYLHDRFGDSLEIVNDRLDTVFSPTDWMQAVDHAANGEFSKLQVFAGEVAGKKLIEAIFPFGGTVLTQAYDYAKMVSDEVQAWGNQKDVQSFVRGYMSQYESSWRTMNSEQFSTAWLTQSFNKEWGEARERYGWAQWTKSRAEYLDKQLYPQSWQSVMNMAAKYRKHVRNGEQLIAEARAEQIGFIKNSHKYYERMVKIAKLLYYAGETESPNINDCATEIEAYLKLDQAQKDHYLKKAREGYAVAMGENSIKQVENQATEFESHYNSYSSENAINRLLSLPNPRYQQFYTNYNQIAERFLSGRLRYNEYRSFTVRNKKAWDSVTMYIVWAVDGSDSMIRRVGVDGEHEKRAGRKGRQLKGELAQHNQKLIKLEEELAKRVQKKAKEKVAEYNKLKRARQPELVEREQAVSQVKKRSSKSVAELSPPSSNINIDHLADYIGWHGGDVGRQVSSLPSPGGEIEPHLQDVEVAFTNLDKRVRAESAEEAELLQAELPPVQQKVQQSLQVLSEIEDWGYKNQNWIDFSPALQNQFNSLHQKRIKAITNGYTLRQRQEAIARTGMANDDIKHLVNNERDYIDFSFSEVRKRVAYAESLSSQTKRLVKQYGKLDINLVAEVPGVLTENEAEDQTINLLEHPKFATFAGIDRVLAHAEIVKRDLGSSNYMKILAPDYIAVNDPAKKFTDEITYYVYRGWKPEEDFENKLKKLKAMVPRFRQVLQNVDAIPHEDAELINAIHSKAVDLKSYVDSAPFQKWENNIVERTIVESAVLEIIKEQFAIIRLANERLDQAIEAYQIAQGYMDKNEPKDRQLVQSLIDDAIKLRRNDPEQGYNLAVKAVNHLEYIKIYVPYWLVDHNTLHVRSHGLVDEMDYYKKHPVKPGDVVDEILNKGNYHVTINGRSSKTMGRFEANEFASKDGHIEIRTESYDPEFKKAEKVMLSIYSGERPKEPTYTVVARNKADFVYTFKVPFEKEYTFDIRILTNDLKTYAPESYPLHFHWGRKPVKTIGDVKVFEVTKQGEVITFFGQIDVSLELKFVESGQQAVDELHVLGLAATGQYGLDPGQEYGMLRGSWLDLLSYEKDPQSSNKFKHYSTEEEEEKSLRLWEFQAFIEPNEKYDVYQKVGSQWQLVAYVIGMNVPEPSLPKDNEIIGDGKTATTHFDPDDTVTPLPTPLPPKIKQTGGTANTTNTGKYISDYPSTGENNAIIPGDDTQITGLGSMGELDGQLDVLQGVSLAGNWVDKNGHKVSITQNGQKATATAQENNGPVGWKTAPGEVNGNTVEMNFNGWKLTGNISQQGKKISWSNKSVWIRVLSGSGFAGQPGAPADLGKSWDVTEVFGWTGVWTRRDKSNVFDALWTLGGKREKAELAINITGNIVNVKRKQKTGYSFPGQMCEYKGTLAADKMTVKGTYGCDWARGPFNWKAIIRFNPNTDVSTITSKPQPHNGVNVNPDMDTYNQSTSTKEVYSWVDWELTCPQPWKLDVSTSATIIGTRKLSRCVNNNLSAPLRAVEFRKNGILASDVYNVVFFTDPKNRASLTSRVVRRLLHDTKGKLGSEALINIYFNDKKDRWESANRQYTRWRSTGIKDEEMNFFNLQHHRGIWDYPVKTHSKWYPDGSPAYKKTYKEVENPDHWRSVDVSSVAYEPDGRLKMRYEDFVIKQNSDGYWNSFPSHVLSWTGKPSRKNGEFFYEVVQQPSGAWVRFEKKYLTFSSTGEVTVTRLYEIYLDAACNCYKSKRL